MGVPRLPRLGLSDAAGPDRIPDMKIRVTSVMVDDQAKALAFYTDVLGFVPKRDDPAGEFRALTVVSPEGSGETELMLEPNAYPAARTFQAAIYADGIPATLFVVEDLEREVERLKALGVRFTAEPERSEWGFMATFDDTCGNLIRLLQE